MKVLVRNFLVVTRRFRLAITLNILGLSVAFAAFIAIMMQWRYDMTYNKDIPGAENIYRVDCIAGKRGQLAIMCRPLADLILQSSPHILGGSLIDNMMFEFTVETPGGDRSPVYQESEAAVYPRIYELFPFKMVEGSADVLEDMRQALIPQSLARKLFGNESAIGKRLQGIDHPRHYLIVGGVYEDFPKNSSIRNAIYDNLGEENKTEWGNWNYPFYIRLDSPEAAGNLLAEIDAYLESIDVDSSPSGLTLALSPLEDLHFQSGITYDDVPKASRQTVYLLFTIAWVILVIAAINFTNFSTSLAPVRMKSINTQRVLGSTAGALRRSLVLESILISFISFLLSLFLLYVFSLEGLGRLMTAELSFTKHVGLIAATAGVSILLGVFAGAYPAWYMTSFQPALVLKGAFGLSVAGRRMRLALLSFQFIAAFALIIGSLFMYLQNRYTRTAPLGYDKDLLLVADLSSGARQSTDAVQENLQRIAGVEAVALSAVTISGQDSYMHWSRDFRGSSVDFDVLPVDKPFLKVLGIAVEEGRDFRESDWSKGAVIFNRKGADQFQIALGDKIDTMEVVGIVPDIQYTSFRSDVSPMIFVYGNGWYKKDKYVYIRLKPGVDAFSVREQVGQVLSEFDAEYPVELRFYDEILENLYWSERNLSTLIYWFSFLAIFISIVGVFGLVVFDSEYRRKEIGVRKVLGSTTAEVLLLFTRVYLRILAVCFVVALPFTWYAVHAWLENFARKTPMYLWVYLVAFLAVALLTVLTVTYQSWRAANSNPVDSLKTE